MTAMQEARDDYRLTTVEIFFHSFDNPDDLQSLVWQDYDLAPDYPELRRFLTYWSRHIDGVVHSVRVAGAEKGKGPVRGKTERMLSTSVH